MGLMSNSFGWDNRSTLPTVGTTELLCLRLGQPIYGAYG